MKVFGQLEKAQLENDTSDTASHPEGMIIYRTDLNYPKVSNGAVYKALIDEDSVQTLSGKIFSDIEVNGSILIDEIATPATPASGEHKLYFKSDNKLYSLDDTGAEEEVGSGGGGGGINHITNPEADGGLAGWNEYDDDSGATNPVDGTGDAGFAGTGFSLTRETTDPFRGVGSFKISYDGSNARGRGVSTDIQVDRADLGNVVEISFDYVTSTNYLATDMRVWLYDIDGTALWIQLPDVEKMLVPGRYKHLVQLPYNATKTSADDLRLIFHCSVTTGTAWDFEFDNVKIGPPVRTFGVPSTDWTAFTPTGNWTNTTYTGFWRRVGDSMEVNIMANCDGGTPTGGNFQVSISPTGYSVDTSKIENQGHEAFGSAIIQDSGLKFFEGTVLHISGNTFGAISGSNGGDVATGSVPMAWVINDSIGLNFTVPIVGWSTNVQMSDSSDGRVVAARYTSNTADPLTSAVAERATFENKVYDTHSAVTFTDFATQDWIFTAPCTGKYRYEITTLTKTGGGWAAGEELTLEVLAAGSLIERSLNRQTATHGQPVQARAAGTIDLNAGETLYANITQNSGADLDKNPLDRDNVFSVEKISGPSAIAANELIAARITHASTTAMNAATPFVYDTIDYDTHGAYNVSTGVFTCPASGKYEVSAKISLATVSLSAGDSITIDMQKNGTTVDSDFFRVAATLANSWQHKAITTISCSSGDTLEIDTSASAAANTINNSIYNSVMFRRVGF